MDYAERLIECGFSPEDAWFIVDEFMSDGDIEGLEIFTLAVEQRYVGGV